MARPWRIDYSGAIEHVSGRMLGRRRGSRERLFPDERDDRRFMERLGEAVGEFGVRLYVVWLMSNHFHLVMETGKAVGSRLQCLEHWKKVDRKLRGMLLRLERSLEAKREAQGSQDKTKEGRKK
jgi:hypothetical protein